MDIINFIFDIISSPLSWLIWIPFLFGYVWIPKTNVDEVLAAHINDLQTKKLDNAGAETVTGAWEIQAQWAFTGQPLPLSFSNDGDCAVWWFAYDDGVQNNPTIKMARAHGTGALPTIVAENDPCGEWTSYGHDGVGFIRVARIYMDVDGTPGVDDMPGRIDFEVTPAGATDPICRLSILNNGQIAACGDSAQNTKMTRGITIRQGALDDEILAFQSSDVEHGVTDLAETTTYGCFKKWEGLTGGLSIEGYTESIYALKLFGIYTIDTSDKDATAWAPLMLYSAKRSGTGIGDVGADANVLAIKCRRGGAYDTIFIVDEDGDILYDGTSNPYQDHDDIALCQTLEATLDKTKKIKERAYKKKDLEDLGITKPFLSTKAANMLLLGAIRQLNEKIISLEDRLN